MEYLVEAIQQCASAAEGTNVRFALEPMNRYETDLIHTAADGLDLINRVGAENFGLLLDTFHMNIEEPTSARVSARAATGSSTSMSPIRIDGTPARGTSISASILEDLEKTGYQGFVSGEFMPLPDADTAAENGIAYLRNL